MACWKGEKSINLFVSKPELKNVKMLLDSLTALNAGGDGDPPAVALDGHENLDQEELTAATAAASGAGGGGED